MVKCHALLGVGRALDEVAWPKDALLTQSVTTIDAIEALTGMDFLPDRRTNTRRSEAAIERAQGVELWER